MEATLLKGTVLHVIQIVTNAGDLSTVNAQNVRLAFISLKLNVSKCVLMDIILMISLSNVSNVMNFVLHALNKE